MTNALRTPEEVQPAAWEAAKGSFFDTHGELPTKENFQEVMELVLAADRAAEIEREREEERRSFAADMLDEQYGGA